MKDSSSKNHIGKESSMTAGRIVKDVFTSIGWTLPSLKQPFTNLDNGYAGASIFSKRNFKHVKIVLIMIL